MISKLSAVLMLTIKIFILWCLLGLGIVSISRDKIVALSAKLLENFSA